MNLINKKLLEQKILSFEFPNPERLTNAKKLLEGWQKALKDSDLERTKEKSVQGKFLSTFFEDILGYTDVTTGNDEWTLIQHPRIENDSKEPDGSLGWFTKDKKITRAVIELKDAKTQLDKKQNRGSEKLTPIEQGYLYATKYDGCNWIIVSNFREIRLYNKHKTQEYYEKFDVVDLIQENEFKRFYFLLSKDTLITKDTESIIDILAKDTLEAEQDITKKFYAEYKQVRLNLFQHLIDNNESIEKEVLLEKAQKLLDRFIFTLFCEDTSSLLPLNIVKTTYERALNSLSPSDERVWTEFRGLFIAIDKGNSRVTPPINAYNGGLFAFDEILDRLSVKDEFWTQIMGLSEYDFETDLNVNILGHIFEQSISDLESLKSELRGEEQDKKKSKRKKDGIYYTPEYITRYIVENTVGKYLEENPDKLSSIKILDPACGSGAFLNQAHSFLSNEYKVRHEALIAEKQSKGEAQTLFDYNPAENNKGILLNNLYGVDLNQESVEITKLALWLKTARKTEPLQNLDKNIKCGNSLIDDPEVAGEKAFNWNNEFKEIMDDGGFDVIIGNPPYVNGRVMQEAYPNERQWLKVNYKTLIEKWDIYIAFIEKSFDLLNSNGYMSFIIPDSLLTERYGELVRKYIQEYLVSIDHFNGLDIFEGVGVKNVIVTIKKSRTRNVRVIQHRVLPIQPLAALKIVPNVDAYRPFDYTELSIPRNSTPLSEICYISKGMVLNADEKRYKGEFTKSDLIRKEYDSLHTKPILQGEDIQKWLISRNSFIEWNTGRVPNKVSRPTFPELHERPKLVTNKLGELKVAFDSRGVACEQTVRMLIKWEDLKDVNNPSISSSLKDFENKSRSDLEKQSMKFDYYYLLAILNSSFIHLYFKQLQGNSSLDVNPNYLRAIPIVLSDNPEVLNNLALKLTDLFSNKENLVSSIAELLLTEFGLKARIDGDFGWNYINENLSRQGIHISLEKKEELQNWIKKKQTELNKVQIDITECQHSIDKEVYRLYALSQEEIAVIEEIQ